MLGSSNPTLTPEVFQANTYGRQLEAGKSMTIQGTINVSLILGAICAACAIIGWGLVSNNKALLMPFCLGSCIGGLAISLLLYFKPNFSPFLAPVYAAGQGLFIGGISLLYAEMSKGTKLGGTTGNGIVLQAGILTFGVLFGMLFLYKANIIRATGKFVAGVLAATIGVGVFFLGLMLMRLLGMDTSWASSGIIGIGISAVVVVIASMNLIIDFAVIEEGAESNQPKYMEWYAAFGLMVTVIWLYLSILRLLSMLNKRD